MTSRFGAKTYSRPQKMCQSSIQFDQAFGENKKKPSAAKSTGILHRWGKTSFTSTRSSQGPAGPNPRHHNGRKDDRPPPAKIRRTQQQKHPVAVQPQPQPQPEPKPQPQHDPFTFDLDGGGDCETAPLPVARSPASLLPSPRKPLAARPNKFFKSGNSLSRRSGHAEVTVSVPRVFEVGPEHGLVAVVAVAEVPVTTEEVAPVAEEVPVEEEEVPVAEEEVPMAEEVPVAEEEEEFAHGEPCCAAEVAREYVEVEQEGEEEEAKGREEGDGHALGPKEETASEESALGTLETSVGTADSAAEASSQETLDSGAAALSHFSFRPRRIFNSPKKVNKKSLYKHRLWQEDPASAKLESEPRSPVAPDVVQAAEETETENRLLLTRVTSWSDRLEESVTSVRCSRKSRELYTVVKNVKQAHQCHESGETQEFNDDIEYLLEGLQETNGVGTRCLSVLSLASKCMAPAFRMHLRAHGTFTKVFCALHDAPGDTNLSLCTATVLFILSQDRLNMDLERNSLELILQLLDVDSRPAHSLDSLSKDQAKEYDKNRQKVRELCDQLHKTGHAKHLDLDNIGSGTLAMETLLSLTSRQAGEWFKEELRDLGGLDHIVGTVSECGYDMDEDGGGGVSELVLERLKKMDRCLRVLENVTFMNAQNQLYLIDCKDSILVITCVRALKVCEDRVSNGAVEEETSPVLVNCALSILKVFLNLTNENPQGSERIGDRDGLVDTVLRCVLRLPKFIGAQQRFDLLILALGLLVNLAEHGDGSRKTILASPVPGGDISPPGTAVKELVNLFLEREAAARLEEAKTDSLLDGKGDGEEDPKAKETRVVSAQALKDEIEETLTKALQKAGKHMEDSMVAAYVALLLGCLIKDKKENAGIVRDNLPDGDFQVMVLILRKFLNFVNLTTVVGNAGVKSIQHVIDVLEAS